MAKIVDGRTVDELDERQDDQLDEATQKLIQSETDKVRTRYSRELKEKETALEELRTQLAKFTGDADGESRKLYERGVALQAGEELLKRKADAMVRAAENKLPLALAVEVASLQNSADVLDKIAEVIEDRTKARMQESRVSNSGPCPGGGEERPDVSSYSECIRLEKDEQLRRIKQDPKVFTKLLDKAARG